MGAAVAVLALLFRAEAQSAPRLVALTSSSPVVAQIQVSGGSCRAISCPAQPFGLGPRVHDRAGGTAWDGRQSAAWVSDGRALALVRVADSNPGCSQACPPIRAPLPFAGTRFVTGLSYSAAGAANQAVPGPAGRLFLAYDDRSIGWMDAKGCALGVPNYCSLAGTLAVTRGIGAIAADGVGEILYVATSSIVSTSPANIIYGLRMNAGCAVFCKFTVTVNQALCTNLRLGPITGMAYDGCRELLYITDGKIVIFGTLQTNATSCRFVHKGCCAGAANEELVGLALRPAGPVAVGKACTRGGCGSCTSLRVSLMGDPVLGNGEFGFVLDGAPANFNVAILAMGFAPCDARGLSLGFCEPIRIALAPFRPLVFSFANPAPGVGCSGKLRVPLAIPVNRGLCGFEMSVQWVLACPQGDAVTPCLSLAFESL